VTLNFKNSWRPNYDDLESFTTYRGSLDSPKELSNIWKAVGQKMPSRSSNDLDPSALGGRKYI